jgi:hypothetical protein
MSAIERYFLEYIYTEDSLEMLTKTSSEVLNGRQSFGVLLTDGKYMFKVLPPQKSNVSEKGVDSNDPG